MINLTLDWKNFKVNAAAIDTKLRDQFGDKFYGTSADTSLRLHFSDLTPEEEHQIKEWYDSLTPESPEAQYKSQAEINAEKEQKKQAALAKLTMLGLTEEDLKALGL